jgi:hypothetical protein
MSVRRMFMIRCLRRGCGATAVKDLGISAALAGVIINPQRQAPIAKTRAHGRGTADPDDF